MPLDNYTCFTLQNCFIEAFCEYIKQVDNLRRLVVIGSHKDYSIKLSVITNRRIEVAFNEGCNTRNSIENIIHE